jgi:hypothetical protein
VEESHVVRKSGASRGVFVAAVIAVRQIDRFTAVEATLHRDVLNARTGLLGRKAFAPMTG